MKNTFYSSFLLPALLYGAILGMTYIILSIISTFLHLNYSTFQRITVITLSLAGLIYFLYNYRKNYLNNYISYGRAFGMGISIMIAFGVFAAFYDYIYASLINPDFFKEVQTIMEEKLLDKQISPDIIELMIEKTEKFRTPIIFSLSNLLGFIFRGTVFSLIISAFIKKEDKDVFKDVI